MARKEPMRDLARTVIGEDTTNPDPGVRVIVSALRGLQWFVAYWYLVKIRRLKGSWFAYVYVGVFLAALVALLVTSSAWVDDRGVVFWVALFVTVGRTFDLLRWSASFLLDRGHYHVVSPERNLVFTVLNLGETVLIGAIWLRAAERVQTAGSGLFKSFALVTQLELPDKVTTAWAKVAVATTEVTALVLLLGGVAVLLSEVQEKIRSTGAWSGPR